MKSIFAKKINYVPVKLEDPMMAGGKIGFVISPGPCRGRCEATGREITYQPHDLYSIIGVVSDMEAARKAGWFNYREVETEVCETKIEKKVEEEEKVSETVEEPKAKPIACPECSGSPRGRGYAHTAECSLNSKNRQKQTRRK